MKKISSFLVASFLVNSLATVGLAYEPVPAETVTIDSQYNVESDVNVDFEYNVSADTQSFAAYQDNTEYSDWSIDLKYLTPAGDGNAVIYYPDAIVDFEEKTGAYSISINVSGGTIMSALPVVEGADYIISASMNLAKSEVVYSFKSNGVGIGIPKDDVQTIIRQIMFTRTAGADMAIAINIDGRYTNLPNGMTLTAGTDNVGLGGHYYGLVSDYGISWDEAYTDARSLYYKGMQGYLVTVTRAEEEAVLGRISSTTAWSGGTRSTYKSDNSKINGESSVKNSDLEEDNRIYYWSAGPEAGQEFLRDNNSNTVPTSGTSSTTGTNFTVLNNSYYNPGTAMNNGKHRIYGIQSYIMVFNNGGWNDLWNDQLTVGANIPVGYFIEFGDSIVPTSGQSDYYDENGLPNDNTANATVETVAPNIYLEFTPADKVYDGTPIEADIVGGSSEAVVVYYRLDEDGNKISDALTESEVIEAGSYLGVITDGNVILNQKFVISPQELDVIWTGGPYEYNSKEQIPTVTLVNDVFVGDDACEVLSVNVEVSKSDYYNETDRAGTDAGNHVASVKLSNSNYFVSDYTYEITRKLLTASTVRENYVYTGDSLEFDIDLEVLEFDANDILDDVVAVFTEDVIEKGDYNMSVALNGFHADNYYVDNKVDIYVVELGIIEIFDAENNVIEVVKVPVNGVIEQLDADGNSTGNFITVTEIDDVFNLIELEDEIDEKYFYEWDIQVDEAGNATIQPIYKEKVYVDVYSNDGEFLLQFHLFYGDEFLVYDVYGNLIETIIFTEGMTRLDLKEPGKVPGYHHSGWSIYEENGKVYIGPVYCPDGDGDWLYGVGTGGGTGTGSSSGGGSTFFPSSGNGSYYDSNGKYLGEYSTVVGSSITVYDKNGNEIDRVIVDGSNLNSTVTVPSLSNQYMYETSVDEDGNVTITTVKNPSYSGIITVVPSNKVEDNNPTLDDDCIECNISTDTDDDSVNPEFSDDCIECDLSGGTGNNNDNTNNPSFDDDCIECDFSGGYVGGGDDYNDYNPNLDDDCVECDFGGGQLEGFDDDSNPNLDDNCVECEFGGGLGSNKVDVYDDDGELVGKLDLEDDDSIFVEDADGNIIGKLEIVDGTVTLPELPGDNEIEGWYPGVDEFGNLVYKPIITAPTMSEDDFLSSVPKLENDIDSDLSQDDIDENEENKETNISTYVPQTNDSNVYLLWIAVFILSVVAFFVNNKNKKM